MKTFQIIFQNGRVQNLMAESCKQEDGVVRFHTENGGVIEFTPAELVTIDELETEASPEETQSSPGELVE